MHELPKLSYEYDALEPYIDARTMEIHHAKHHQAYIDRLNTALEGHDDLTDKDVANLLRDINEVPKDIRQAIINHGGGHVNHSLFWSVMLPDGGGEPKDDLADAINDKFGNFDSFKEEFAKVTMERFGSGWAWLVLSNGVLSVMSTGNQDSPLLEGKIPILGLDVWEHAYYLNYQNRRSDYVDAWWNIVNWQEVLRRFKEVF